VNITQQIKTQIVLLASFAGRDLNPMMIQGYMEAINDLDQNAVLAALRAWLKNSKGFPHPSDIREVVAPEMSAEDDAQDVANLIVAAVGSCGHTNPDRAREKIGELGWATVLRMGGWKHLCEVLTPDNEGIFRAQIRDYAQTIIRKSIRGDLERLPELPRSSKQSAQELEDHKTKNEVFNVVNRFVGVK